MKLSECIIGTPVIRKGFAAVSNLSSPIGHIIGFTYNVSVCQTGEMSPDEKVNRTIPLIRWADGTESGIHHGNIKRL